MKDDASELDGAFLGDVDGEQTAADIQIEVDTGGVRFRIKRLGSKGKPAIVQSTDPVVRFWQLRMHHALKLQAANGAAAALDDPPCRTEAPKRVLCPACLGIEPEKWDCDLCKGGGFVPG